MYKVLCYGKFFILKEKLVSLFYKLKQKALDDDENVAKVEFTGSSGWFDCFLK